MLQKPLLQRLKADEVRISAYMEKLWYGESPKLVCDSGSICHRL